MPNEPSHARQSAKDAMDRSADDIERTDRLSASNLAGWEIARAGVYALLYIGDAIRRVAVELEKNRDETP